jgi:DNA-binding response OmpR family regulator
MSEKRALICEDDASIRSLVRTVVAREGFKVDVAEDGRVGIEKMKEGAYELVVLDLMMPHVDGYEVVRFLKESRPERLKRVIIMTAATDAMQKQFPEPVCTVLPKPFDIDKLRRVVQHCSKDCDSAAE